MNSRLNEIKDWPARAEARGFNVAAVAKDCGTGPRQLERFIRLHTGETPKKWFNSIRLQKAVSLREAGQSVKQVATTLVYSHAQQFATAFKKFHGRTPSSVRAISSLSALPT